MLVRHDMKNLMLGILLIYHGLKFLGGNLYTDSNHPLQNSIKSTILEPFLELANTDKIERKTRPKGTPND